MKRRQAGVATAVVVGSVALSVVWGVTPAWAHTHPTPVELSAPAVVQVRTDALVNISLLVHQAKAPHIELFQRTYQVPLATNSGFAVAPTGVVVTTGRALDVDLGRATRYAVNRIFEEVYPDRAPLPPDPYSRTVIPGPPGDPLNARLQQCYAPNTAGERGGCIVATTRQLQVLPFVSDQRRFGNLSAAVVYPEEGVEDVAVLRVGASSMPTARLGSALEGGAYSVLGFTQTPSDDPASLTNLQGHFAGAGQPEVKVDETVGAQLDALRHGLQGGPVIGEKGEALGFLTLDVGPTKSAAGLSLVGPDTVRQALDEAKVTPHQGPTDVVYDAASHDYKNGLYAAALPHLAETLKLYPGHALASAYSADASSKAGTSADQTGKELPGRAPADAAAADQAGADSRLLMSVIGLLALSAVVVLALRRWSRSRRSTRAAATTPTESSPRKEVETVPGGVAVGSTLPRQGDPGPDAEATSPRSPSGRGDRDPEPTQVPAPAVGPAPGQREGTPRTRARAAAASPAQAVATARRDNERAHPAAVRKEQSCRVCGQPGSRDMQYCESCGYSAV